MRRKVAQNDICGTSFPCQSFLQFTTPQLSSSLLLVCVKLGSNEKEILVSANALRRLEFDRLRVAPVS